MIRTFTLSEIPPEQILCRDIRNEINVEAAVEEIIAEVRRRGDEALYDYCEKFDRIRPDTLEVSAEEIAGSLNRVDPKFLETLLLAKENIQEFHRHQLHKNFVITGPDGTVMGQRYQPIERAGLYVPGGTASYPSTVLMDAVPAKLAGVRQLVMVTPPGPDGSVPDVILAAAHLAGVDRVFRIGGAQAIAALAYGTESVPRVDKIVGPGNIYVAAAKRRVFGQVSIDMIAGPSEILVLADDGANARCVAADMLSQAEHDRLATAVLVTPSERLAKAVEKELERQIPLLPRAEIARESIDVNGKIILCNDLKEAVSVSNLIAPEHLELCVEEPFALLDGITNAGSVFLGHNVPEALGDYLAGPNHTLPTSGTARFSSPLSVDDFVKKSSYLYYSREALKKVCGRVALFARAEGLEAHARSIESRFEED
ncbi:MAG: histidinol dehydrogenase [Christensenellales bacterium]|nr:histidinol dehydrogenase [Christensenellales bacterium]